MLKTLQENLKYFRELNDYTQEELSLECNYDKTYVGKIERGDTNPSVEAILRISDVLGVPSPKFFQEIVSGDPDKFDDQITDPTSQVGGLFVDVFENAPAIAFLTNPDGEILQLNRAAEKFLKAESNSLIGQSILELPYWGQLGIERSTLKDLVDLGTYGKKATQRISVRYKGEDHDLQVQVSFAEGDETTDKFLIVQFFLIEETVDRTVVGDHFDLLRR